MEFVTFRSTQMDTSSSSRHLASGNRLGACASLETMRFVPSARPYRSVPPASSRDLRHHQLAERALALLRRGSPLDVLAQQFTPEAAFHTLFCARSQRALALRFLQWAQPQPFFPSSLRLQCLALHLLTGFRRFGAAQTLAQGLIRSTAAAATSSFQEGHADPKVLIFEGLRDTQKLCSKPRSSAVFDLLVKSYSSLQMVPEALGTLELAKSSGFIPGVLAYNSIIDAMFRSKVKFCDILGLYDEMVKSNVSSNVYSYNILIRGFCSDGDLERGLECLRDMETVGCSPNVVTFNTLIDAYCKLGRVDDAFEALMTMPQKGIQPNIVTYNAILNGLCREGRIRETQKVLDELIGRGLIPNEVTYNTLVNGYCNEGDVHQALVLHAEMLQKGVAPDVVTYTSLICAMCRNGNLGRAMEFVEQMRGRGLHLNEVTYTTLIDGFSKKGYLEDAHVIMKEMIESGFLPSVVPYNALVNGYCTVGRMNEALIIAQEMEKKGLKPDVVTYCTILTGYCRNGELEKAFQLNQEMIEKGVLPDKVTFSSLIRGLCEGRRLTEAHELFEKMLSLNLTPDEFTYTTLIDGYCKEGDIGKAIILHDEMLKKRILPDVVTYSVLINGLSRKARTHEARQLLFRLVYEESIPDDVTYDVLIGHCDNTNTRCVGSLIKGFCVKGLMDEAGRVFESMIERNVQPDEAIYNVIIHGYCRARNVKKAFDLYKKMMESGYAPNAFCALSLIKGLFDEGMNDELSHVVQELLKRCSLTDTEPYKVLVDINYKEGNMDIVLNVLSEMVKDGFLPNSGNFSSSDGRVIHVVE